MPACCSWNDVFQYETNKVTRIQSANYGTIKWILHMTVFSYVRLVGRGMGSTGQRRRQPHGAAAVSMWSLNLRLTLIARWEETVRGSCPWL